MLLTEEEAAINKYVEALKSVGKDPNEYVFEVTNGRIRLGLKDGDFTQWQMMWFTPEEFERMAERRRRNRKSGDPKKRDAEIY